ncbi:MBL fold metallo-hydrolase [Pseudonocardia nigra]|uniref:MBL fold metallo-hydrolase n=1 Tax=Pseudonocardia nigra TaxID=1921578 RepID=UPI001C5CE01E|nr:MBL fold metallo-hydrolase [Pseudonocardia nigra]
MRVRPDEPDLLWSTPGVYAVAPGVHRIPLPLPGDALKAVNVYALDLDRDGGTLLVDAGQIRSGADELLAAGLAALGRKPSDVRRVLVTHVHRDHYTLAVEWRRGHGAEVALGIGERDSLHVAGGPAHALDPQLAALRRCGADELVRQLSAYDGRDGMPRDIWEEPDDWLADGAVLPAGDRDLQAVETPGHTRGHLVYHDASGGLLFAGDHVLPHITPSIGFEAVRAPHPLRDYLGSLRRVRGMPDARLLPAHGRVIASAHARIDELLEHHDARLSATERAIRSGRNTAACVAGGLTWTRRDRTLAELDPFHRMLAVLETESHLDLLALQGRLVGEDVDGVRHYRA